MPNKVGRLFKKVWAIYTRKRATPEYTEEPSAFIFTYFAILFWLCLLILHGYLIYYNRKKSRSRSARCDTKFGAFVKSIPSSLNYDGAACSAIRLIDSAFLFMAVSQEDAYMLLNWIRYKIIELLLSILLVCFRLYQELNWIVLAYHLTAIAADATVGIYVFRNCVSITISEIAAADSPPPPA